MINQNANANNNSVIGNVIQVHGVYYVVQNISHENEPIITKLLEYFQMLSND